MDLPKTRCGILSLRSELLVGKFIVGKYFPLYRGEKNQAKDDKIRII